MTMPLSNTYISCPYAMGPTHGGLDGGSPMSHVDFKKWQCHMSPSLISSISHVEYKKKICHTLLHF